MKTSAAEQWYNLVRFARSHDMPIIRVTAAQQRELVYLPWNWSDGPHPFTPQLGRNPATIFGHPIEVVPEGRDLASAIEGASLGVPRIRSGA